jgi:hypothetical protein
MLAADPSLAHLSPLLSPASFVVDGYIGLGVPIGTDAFIQHFVKDSPALEKLLPPYFPGPVPHPAPPTLCVFITAVPNTKLFAWGEEDSGGHVL